MSLGVIKYKKGIFLLSVLLFLPFVVAEVNAIECGANPTPDCTISTSTTFNTGLHTAHNMTVVANDITVDCNGAILKPQTPGKDMFYVGGTSGVTITNCVFTPGPFNAYRYAVTNAGVRVGSDLRAVQQLTIKDSEFSGNGNAPIYLTNRLSASVVAASSSPNHVITNNVIKGLHIEGIKLTATNNSLIDMNDIASLSGRPAVLLDGSANTIVKNNTITRGNITLQPETTENAANNTIFINSFEQNPSPVQDAGSNNQWSSIVNVIGLDRELGNFYASYHRDNQCVNGKCCTDTNIDNVCDNPWNFSNALDNFPMRSKSLPHTAPPTIQPIATITVAEREVARVVINATSANNPITYHVNNSLFVQNSSHQNEFTWETNFGQAGVYTFTAIVNDSVNLQSEKAFTVNITAVDKNCKNFPNNMTNGCIIMEDITLPPGTYNIPTGIAFGANNVELNCRGATLVGSQLNTPMIYVGNTLGATIRNCRMKGYKYAVSNLGSPLLAARRVIIRNNIFEAAAGNTAILITHWLGGSTIAPSPAVNHRIIKNTIAGNHLDGIYIIAADNMLIRDNIVSTVLKTGNAMQLAATAENTIRNNTIKQGRLIVATALNKNATNNTIFLNTFEQVTNQPLFDMGVNNQWSSQVTVQGQERTLGNFYQGYHRDNQCISGNCCIDTKDFDNVCDQSLIFNGVQDIHPMRSKELPYKAVPNIQSIPTQNVRELGVARIFINASGSGPFAYQVHDPRFKQDPNNQRIFRWSTNLSDSGTHQFNATVRDRFRLWNVTEFTVTVNNSASRLCHTFPDKIANGCLMTQSTVLNPRGRFELPDGIKVGADNIVLNCRGATLVGLRNGGPLISLEDTSGVTIRNCHLKNYAGAILSSPESGYFTIRDNVFTSTAGGGAIRLESPLAPNTTRSSKKRHLILNNTISGVHNIGVIITNANRSLVALNNFSNLRPADRDVAIYIVGGTHNRVVKNIVNGAQIIVRRGRGTAINTTITDNTIENMDTAIELAEGVEHSVLRKNTIRNMRVGMVLRGSHSRIRANTFEAGTSFDATQGIVIESLGSPRNNTILLNDFQQITHPADDRGIHNQWNDEIVVLNTTRRIGNFYSQFSKNSHSRQHRTRPRQWCRDLNFDNLCDGSFDFDGNNDSFAMRSLFMESNFPPIIEPIPEIILNESEAVILRINATGYNETLFYSLTDNEHFKPVPGKENEFMWQTNFKDAGKYNVTVIVRDALDLNSGMEVNITLTDAPDSCHLYSKRVANGCAVRADTAFPVGEYSVPDGITIAADNVNVLCNNATLKGDNLGKVAGINLDGVQNIVIDGCNVAGYDQGIIIQKSNSVNLSDIRVSENRKESSSNGIEIYDSERITIKGSDISKNNNAGVFVIDSNNNVFERNSINENSGSGGIILRNASKNKIYNNKIFDNDLDGILLAVSTVGGTSDGNEVIGNTIKKTKTSRGLGVGGANNIIYHNNFIDNKEQVFISRISTGTKLFVNGEGNYYSDHSCVGNRMCANAYQVRTNHEDKFPFRYENGWLLPEPTFTVQGSAKAEETMNITLSAPIHQDETYVFALSLGNATGIPLGNGRTIHLDNDIALQFSLEAPSALGFVNSVGNLDKNGQGTITWTPPKILKGFTFHAGYVTIDTTKPFPDMFDMSTTQQITIK